MIIDLLKSKNYLINLNKDKKRLEESLTQLKKIKIPVERFDAISNEKGIVGCGMSHLKLLEDNKKFIPSSHILALEDDIQLVEGSNSIIFDVPDNTDALYLGISKFGFLPKNNVGILNAVFTSNISESYKRIFNMCSTHAIVYISESYVNAVIDTINYCLKNNIAFDLGIASIHKYFNIITPQKPIFFQSDQKEVTDFIFP